MSDDAILAASNWVAQACGTYPDTLKQIEGGFTFETKLAQLALDAFPVGEDADNTFLYEVIKTEISGDEEGWYTEAVLWADPPENEKPGSIVEGLYSRRIEIRGEIEANFSGNLFFTADSDDHQTKLGKATQGHYKRSLDEIGTELSHFLSSYANNVRLLKADYDFSALHAEMAILMRQIAAPAATHG